VKLFSLLLAFLDWENERERERERDGYLRAKEKWFFERDERAEEKQEERENPEPEESFQRFFSLSAIYRLSSPWADQKIFPLFLSVGRYILHLMWTP